MISFQVVTMLCISLALISRVASSPTVESSSIADKNRYLLAGLEKLKDDISKNDWVSMPNLYMLSPEELRFLEYKNVLEKARQSYCATVWPDFLISKQETPLQNKMKKNSEMSRGMYNALNHLDMFNAGK